MQNIMKKIGILSKRYILGALPVFMIASISCNAANLDVNKGVFTLDCGKYEVTISAECKYTIRSIKYEDYYLCPAVGYNATVIVPLGGKFIGSGHLEGGEEVLEKIEFYIDSNMVKPEIGRMYSGRHFLLKRTSLLDKLRLVHCMELSDNGIVEKKMFEAIDDQKIDLMYIFFYCWNKITTQWCAELADGKNVSGVFRDDRSYHLKEDIKWCALYEPEMRKGVIMFYPEILPGENIKSAIWDVGGTYHKYYHQLRTDKLIKKGTKSAWMIIVIKGFSAAPDIWNAESEKISEKLNSITY